MPRASTIAVPKLDLAPAKQALDHRRPHREYAPRRAPLRPYSYSQLSLADTAAGGCLRRYWLKYVAKAPEAPDTRALRLGSAVHDVLEAALRAAFQRNQRPYPNVNAMRAAIDAAMPRVDRGIADDAKRAAMNALAWVDSQSFWLSQFEVVEVEYGLNWHEDGGISRWDGERENRAEGAIFRAKIDLLLLQPLTAIIVDWKSGKTAYQATGALVPQLDSYTLLAASAFPGVTHFNSTFVNIGLGAKAEPWRTYTRPVAPNAAIWLSSNINAIEGRDWADQEAWPPMVGDKCHFCSWKNGCPAMKKNNATRQAQEVLTATLQRVSYEKKESDWKIMVFSNGSAATAKITVKGELSTPIVGAEYEISGAWQDYNGQREFKALAFRPRQSHTPEAARRVLERISWFGPARAQRALEAFGGQALDVLRESPEKMAAAVGMPAAQAAEAARQLNESWAEADTKAALLDLLPSAHTRTINAIWRAHGARAVQTVKADPYVLTAVHGIGWETADSVAAALGIAGADPRRIRAGVMQTMLDAESDGHTMLPGQQFAEAAVSLLGVAVYAVRAEVAFLIGDGQLRVISGHVQRATRAEEERFLANRLYEIRHSAFGSSVGFSAEAVAPYHLTDEQDAAVRGLLGAGCGVLTGGPGTGKTTTLRALLACLPPAKRVALAAPTGKAAKVLSAAVGRQAVTVHRLLAVDPMQSDADSGKWEFLHNEHNPIPADVVVIDETSMLDHALGAKLLAAVRPGTWVFFIGDVDQLPAVGAGDLLGALTRAEFWPVHRLTKVHRNAGVGRAACAQIIQGSAPVFGDAAEKADENGNNCWSLRIPREEQAEMLRRLIEWCRARGFDPKRDVAVLSANSRRQGPASAPELNRELQLLLNAEGVDTGLEDGRAETTWRIGDRLMQTRNNYDYDLVNGDIGTLTAFDADAKTITFQADALDEPICCKRSELDLRLAYAATVHKYQGSQAPVVIVCLDYSSQQSVVSRQWLYTAISRFQSYCFVLYSGPHDIEKTTAKLANARHTGLGWLLKGGTQ